MNIEDKLKEDFRYFLTAVWTHLSLPAPTRAQLCIAEYLQHGPKRLQIQAFRGVGKSWICLLYTSPSPRDRTRSRMPSSA